MASGIKQALLFLVLFCAGYCASATDFDGLVDLEQQKLHVVQAGHGPITVVFEAGFASDLSVWRRVAPEVAKKAQVFLYSRAGMGKSPAPAQVHTFDQDTLELEKLLEQSQAKPPYILVGHSYGSFLIRAFASRHPGLIAGMVFVDPADEGMESALKQINAARVLQDRQALLAAIPAKWHGDLEMIQQLLDAGKLPITAPLPDVPTYVLTSVRAREGSDFFQETPVAVQLKRSRHQAFFAQFSNGAHLVTSNSGHTIQLQEPELVVHAVEQVLTSANNNMKRMAYERTRKAILGEFDKAQSLLDQNKADMATNIVSSAIRDSQFNEADVNNLGFELLTKRKQVALAGLVLQYNSRAYPQSHNAADSYGEALYALKRYRESKLEFQRALALGTQAAASERALAGYRENLGKAEKAEQ
ncbi:alpha/beta fold hydrolase [Pseudoduganella sp. FT93W]|uniref:Alpha/beta fold hydrolase n=1 Tax=Duganella fentianensis TaxID=2692177 RepID=A0A845HX84_9BURK|nr:alpha/beta fold hydrolase [Duganella fentianensis]MYN45599.1 alpha/beta fold hydrolase [Duganella fentianensis]